MQSDHTQQQSLGGLHRAEKLSLQNALPPAELPGYQLKQALGSGAFGQVWLGLDLNTGRPVAIKFYLHRSGLNLPLLSREVKHLVNMSAGRHIVQVLAVGWEFDPPYYVMEYLENGSLEDMLRARGPLGVTEAVSMLREVAQGLNYAHSKGVLHCDLKPANVVLDHDWRPRLADFGQGRMTDDQTPSLGTLFYMAPEQADLNASPDAAWDVYALGAIGYTMLVGSPPHRSPEVVETLDTAASLPERLERYRKLIATSSRAKLHYRRRGADKALCQIIDRCLSVDPQTRFRNVQQVIEAIDLRQRTRSRRPLYVLGIMGPILLVITMLLFSVRSISYATAESLASVQQRSLESNQFAARYAAQTLENEIQDLFRMVEAESRRDELRTLMRRLEDERTSLLEQLADGEKRPEATAELLNDPQHFALEAYLQKRLQAMIDRQGGDAAAIFNTTFVTDKRGTIVGIAFTPGEREHARSPAGDNFAYRSYFNGERADEPADLRHPSEYRPLRAPHLSASFRSTATGSWKVGVSAPVWDADDYLPDGETLREDAEPVGVLVLTINLGDFELLARTRQGVDNEPQSLAALNRFAVLVDGREGNQRGTLLQHPLIMRMDRETMRSVAMPQIQFAALEQLQADGGVTQYYDPAASFEDGAALRGDWIAAIEQVSLPEGPQEERLKSDLWILVQERGSSVAEPIRQLGTQMQRESLIELVTLMLVIILLWYFVFRMGQGGFGRGRDDSTAGDPALESTIVSDR